MALAATIVWEVRPTNGGANNGGGFNSAAAGTDRSQQDAAQVVVDNAAITATTAAANSNVITFTAGYTPTSADVGNIFCATGGTNINAGLYEITAQTGTTWTVTGSTNLTTGGGAGAALTGNMGGARTGLSTGTVTIQSRILAGHKVWVKNEAWNEAATINVAGSSSSPIIIEGYNTARGDAPLTTSTQPKNNRASAAGDAFTTSQQWVFWKYIQVTGAGGSGFVSGTGRITYMHCKSYANGARGFHCSSGDGQDYTGCESYFNTSNGFGTSFNPNLFGCYVHDNAAAGVATNGGTLNAQFNVITSNAGAGMSIDASSHHIFNNTINGNVGSTSDGINLNPAVLSIYNNIISNNGRYGISSGSASAQLFANADYNSFYNNLTANRNNFPTGAHDATTDPTFTGGGTQTFTSSEVNTGTDEITLTGNTLVVDQIVNFTNSGGGLPGGISTNTAYYVKSAGTAITLSASRGGALLNITSGGTGTHTIWSRPNDFSIGTNLKALGWPGLFPGGTSTGYLDIGAVQRQEAAGGTTTIIVAPRTHAFLGPEGADYGA